MCIRTEAMLLFLVALKIFDVCTVTIYMGPSCMPSPLKDSISPSWN